MGSSIGIGEGMYSGGWATEVGGLVVLSGGGSSSVSMLSGLAAGMSEGPVLLFLFLSWRRRRDQKAGKQNLSNLVVPSPVLLASM